MAKSSDKFDYVKITELEVGKRIINKLLDYGIDTIGELKSKTPNEIKAIDGISTASLVEIREALLNQYEYKLQKNPPKKKVEKVKNSNPNFKEEIDKIREHLFLSIRYEKNLGVEYSIAARLHKKYGFDTVMSITPNLKANHPAFYLSTWGVEYIAKNASIPKEKVFTQIVKKKKVEVSEEPKEIQEEIVYQKGPTELKSLKDYLKL